MSHQISIQPFIRPYGITLIMILSRWTYFSKKGKVCPKHSFLKFENSINKRAIHRKSPTLRNHGSSTCFHAPTLSTLSNPYRIPNMQPIQPQKATRIVDNMKEIMNKTKSNHDLTIESFWPYTIKMCSISSRKNVHFHAHNNGDFFLSFSFLIDVKKG